MPPRKWNKKNASKKTRKYKRKFYRKSRFARPLTSTSGLPGNYPMRMRYADVLNITVPAYGVPVLHQFNLNSIYDPDRTGAGHQPYFRDQMAQFYDFYKVRSCNFKFVLTTIENRHYVVSVRPDDNVTIVSNLTLEMERPGATNILFTEVAKPTKFSKRYDIASILKSKRKEYLEDDTYKTGIGSNPVIPTVLNILIANVDASDSSTSVVALTFVMEFDLMLQDITVQAQS